MNVRDYVNIKINKILILNVNVDLYVSIINGIILDVKIVKDHVKIILYKIQIQILYVIIVNINAHMMYIIKINVYFVKDINNINIYVLIIYFYLLHVINVKENVL